MKRAKVAIFGPYFNGDEVTYEIREIVFLQKQIHQTRLIKRVFSHFEAITNAKAHCSLFKREYAGEMK